MSKLKPVILAIEDDPQIRRFLRTGLAAEGFEVFEAENGRKGLVELGTRKPDLLILDLGLPDIDGVEVVKRLREWSSMPVIVLSARSKEHDKIGALDAGADDYLTKPFGIGALLARIRVALRHAAANPAAPGDGVFTVGGLRVDREKRLVSLNGNAVHLTPIEYRLLSALISHAGKVLTHRHLLQEVWGPTHVDRLQAERIIVRQTPYEIKVA